MNIRDPESVCRMMLAITDAYCAAEGLPHKPVTSEAERYEAIQAVEDAVRRFGKEAAIRGEPASACTYQGALALVWLEAWGEQNDYYDEPDEVFPRAEVLPRDEPL